MSTSTVQAASTTFPEELQMIHMDGISWFEAKIPSRLHFCKIQSSGWIDHLPVQHCACGATSAPNVRGGMWQNKNSRRKGRG